MKLDSNTIDKIAHLARLEVDEADKQKLMDDMNKVLSFMDKLNEINTDDIEPLVYMTDEVNVLRMDEVKPDINTRQALQNAPKQDGNYFRVAKVIK